MSMNQKTYKVWDALLTHSNEWMHILSICDHADLTSKQVVRILSGFNSPYLQKEHRSDGTYACIRATDVELHQLRNSIVREFHGIDDDFIVCVEAVLMPIGWVSVTDIAYDTGLKPLKISAALSTMDNVVHRIIGNTQVYAKVE